DPDAEPFREIERAADDGIGHAGLDRGADDRRGHVAHQIRRRQNRVRLYQGCGFFRCGVQGPAADTAGLEPAAAPADPAGRRTHGGLGLAAGRLFASSLGTRHTGVRPPGDQMQAALTQPLAKTWRSPTWRRNLLCGLIGWTAAVMPASAFVAYVSNEKSNTVS